MGPVSRRLTKFIGCQSVSEWRAMQIKMSDYNRVSVGPVAELRMLAETRNAPRSPCQPAQAPYGRRAADEVCVERGPEGQSVRPW